MARLALLALLSLAATLTGYGGGPSAAHAQAESHRKIGTRPEPSARLAGSDRRVSLEDHRGPAVMLNVWAPWCVPYREEIPDLQSIFEEHRGAGLDVVGVGVDEGDYDGDVLGFADAYGATTRAGATPRGISAARSTPSASRRPCSSTATGSSSTGEKARCNPGPKRPA